MGILLYTRRQQGLHKTSELSPQHRGYTFIYPQQNRVHHTHNCTHTLAGILLCTHDQRGLHNTSELSPRPCGYTFIYQHPRRNNVANHAISVVVRAIPYVPFCLLSLFCLLARDMVYFYIPASGKWRARIRREHTQHRGYTFIYPQLRGVTFSAEYSVVHPSIFPM